MHKLPAGHTFCKPAFWTKAGSHLPPTVDSDGASFTVSSNVPVTSHGSVQSGFMVPYGLRTLPARTMVIGTPATA
jgi:hypothetical protein